MGAIENGTPFSVQAVHGIACEVDAGNAPDRLSLQ
jgi:hypothetical protein